MENWRVHPRECLCCCELARCRLGQPGAARVKPKIILVWPGRCVPPSMAVGQCCVPSAEQRGRAGVGEGLRNPQGLWDAVTPSWLARLSDSCHGIQLRAMNCCSYLRGISGISELTLPLQHRQGMETAAPSTY